LVAPPFLFFAPLSPFLGPPQAMSGTLSFSAARRGGLPGLL
jgi:hypothetical protein